MQVTNINHDDATGALSMTFVPETPEGMALSGCINEFIKAFPDDPHKVARYSIAVAKMLGFEIFGKIGQAVTAPMMAELTAELKADPAAMAAVTKAAPTVATQIAAA